MESERTVEVAWPDTRTALIRLNRPDRLNSLTHPMLRSLQQALQEVAAVDDARAVILTGAGRAFCAGVDIHGAAERGRAMKGSAALRYVGQELFADTVKAVATFRLPVIAAVNGPAAGAGMALAAAADVRVAAAGSRFIVGAPRLGLSGGESGLSWLLPRLVGAGRAMEILLTNREISASDALDMGLVTHVVAPEQLLEHAQRIASEIAQWSPFGVAMTKKAVRSALDLSFDAAVELENRTQILAVHTEDSVEAHAAFVEKRAPRWRGR